MWSHGSCWYAFRRWLLCVCPPLAGLATPHGDDPCGKGRLLCRGNKEMSEMMWPVPFVVQDECQKITCQ